MTTRHAPARLAAAALCALALLCGCASKGPASALELIHQQQEQALLRQQEASARDPAPTQAQVALSLIREAQSQGRYFAALAYTDAYRQKFGDTPELAVLRADALRMTGQAARSEQAYRALLATPQAGQAWRGLGLLAGARGDYIEAAADLQHAAQVFPTDAALLSDLGYARLRAGDFNGARVPLGQAAELDPANPKALANLALLLLAEGKPAQAQHIMDQAGLSPDARDRVYQLATEMQSPAPPSATDAGAPSATAIAMPAAVHTAAAGETSTASVASVPSASVPAVLQPLMDRFGTPSVVR